MNKKNKLIRLETNKILSQIYTENLPKSLSFAFVGKGIRRKGELKIKSVNTPFINCRETVCNACRAQVNIDKDIVYWPFHPDKNPIDMSKLRLVLIVDKKVTKEEKRRIFMGKKVLNLLEEKAGWQKSIISSVIHMNYKDKCSAWLLTGPKQWIEVSAMLSLLMLIMRISYNHGSFESNSLKDFKLDIERATTISKTSTSFDLKFLHNIKDYIIPLIRNYDKIFTGDLKKYYPESKNTLAGNGGINALVERQFSYSSEINKNLEKYVFNTKNKEN